MAGFKGWNNEPAEYAILTKTDINGNVLWKKTFGHDSYGSAFYIINKTAGKGCILSGSTTKYYNSNNYKDPLFVKLNSCGEIEWCTVLISPDNNYATGVVPLAEGNYVGMLKYYWSAIIGTERSTKFAKQMKKEGFVRFEELIDEFREKFNDKWLKS